MDYERIRKKELKTIMDIKVALIMELPVLLAAFGPMHRGEICALTSNDINGNVVHVCKNMVLNTERQWIIKSLKSYAGDRYIDYSKFVSEKFNEIEGKIITLNPNEITDKFNKMIPDSYFSSLCNTKCNIQQNNP